MVLQLYVRRGAGGQALSAAALAALALVFFSAASRAEGGSDTLAEAQKFFQAGQYFKSARYAFAAQEQDRSLEAEAHAWTTLGLTRAGLPNAASYFFIRTLQTGNRAAIRRVLTQTENLLVRVGADLVRKYLVRHTTYEDYDALNRSAYLYALGKDTLLDGQEQKALGYLNGMSGRSPLWPFALQLRGTAYGILGRDSEALRDFRACADRANEYRDAIGEEGFEDARKARIAREAEDLRARCQAGEARVLYQQDKFAEADRAYDRIPKASFVWPDTLFEQAWNAFGRQEYNRALGRLVSYKSPALQFVFNSEVDVLRAQTFLALCLYADANDVVNEFNAKYAKVGEDVKRFVEASSSDLGGFYSLGRDALRGSLHTRSDFHRMANRFVRGPYFQNLVAAEAALGRERAAIRGFDSAQPGVTHRQGEGFPGFLDQVLAWRQRSIRFLGGAYVKNSLIDYHSVLISDFEKMAFIKLEMLGRAKEALMNPNATRASGERSRGSVEPSRRDDQYYWSFNGEFWNDELGDYVFGLESECRS